MSSRVIEITSIDDYDKFKRNHRRGIIFYSAEWCEACKEIMPLYTRIANKYYKRIAMAHADIEVCKLDFSRVPVFVSFRKGTELNNMVGANKDALKDFIKEAIEVDTKPSDHPEKIVESTISVPTREKQHTSESRMIKQQVQSRNKIPVSFHDKQISNMKPVKLYDTETEPQELEKTSKRQIYHEIEDILDSQPRMFSPQELKPSNNVVRKQAKPQTFKKSERGPEQKGHPDSKIVKRKNISSDDYVEENHKIKSKIMPDNDNTSNSDEIEFTTKQNIKLKNLLMNDVVDSDIKEHMPIKIIK